MLQIRLAAIAVIILAIAATTVRHTSALVLPGMAVIAPLWLVSLTLGGLALLLARQDTLGRIAAAGLMAMQLPVLASLLPLLPATELAPAWRQAPVLGAGFFALGLAQLLYDANAKKADAALLCTGLAAATAALLLLAQLFDAQPLLSGRGSGTRQVSLLETGLFATLAAAQLAIHPAGPIAGLRGDGAGAHSRRQLLPAALLVPVLVGLLLLLALRRADLNQATAVTLSVMANLILMLAVVGITGRQLDQMDRRKREKQAARERRVRRQGQRDGVTRLLNRLGWEEDLKEAEKRCRKQRLAATVVIIDLDGLKRINDTQGHAAGDAFIQRAAKALKGAARRKDTLARLGGDEFAYLAVGCDDNNAPSLARRLRDALDAAEVPASLGYALRGKGGLKAAVSAADAAMYEDKRARGGGRMA